MKTSKIFSLSMQKLKRNFNRNVIIIIPIIVITIEILIINMIQFSMETYIDSIKNSIELRSISGISYNEENYQEIQDKLRKIGHISMITDVYETGVFALQHCDEMKKGTTDGYIYIKPVNSLTCPDVILGRKINDDDKYVIVLPDKIYANGVSQEYNANIDENEYIDGKELLGQTVKIKFEVDENNKLEKTFQVIGIFDSKKYKNISTPYVPKSVIKEINNELQYKPPSPIMYHMEIVIDDVDNVEYVEKQLYEQDLLKQSKIEQEINNNEKASEYEYNIRSVTHIEISTQRMLKKIELFLLISSGIIFIALLIVTNLNKEFLEKNELGIMKIEGYTSKEIQKIKIIENFFVSLFSIIISIVIFKVILLIINSVSNYIIQKNTIDLVLKSIQEQLWYVMQIPQRIDWNLFTLISIFIIIIELINTYIISKRNLSKSIVELLKE